MIKYKGLLSEVASQMDIRVGFGESEEQYKQRICYSVAGIMGYASLWDVPEDADYISIDHFKTRIRNVLDSYAALYPEIGDCLRGDLPDQIYSLYQETGYTYHSPYRLSPSGFSSAEKNGIQFLRGCAINQIHKVSGLGIVEYGRRTQDNLEVDDMFRLNPSLENIWTQWILNATWEDITLSLTGEFLRLTPPYSYGYWQKEPERSSRITLLRTGFQGNWQYYLYRRNEDKSVSTAQLPEWLVADGGYMLVANAILFHYGILPPAVVSRLGKIVKIRLGYLYPREEQKFFELYSWPEKLIPSPDSFSRIMDADVFYAVKSIFENKGYKFIEG